MLLNIPVKVKKIVFDKFIRRLKEYNYPLREVQEKDNLSLWIGEVCIGEQTPYGQWIYPASFCRYDDDKKLIASQPSKE